MSDTYRIKALRWEGEQSKRPAAFATVMPAMRYSVAQKHSGEFVWWPPNGMPRECASIEDGKRLAEAHWRERLLEALEPVEDTT